MNYEKAYKESFEAAKGLYDAGNYLTKKQMEIVFPQLRESEDERIRKEIIALVRAYVTPSDTCLVRGGSTTREKAEAWLEKQKSKDSEEKYLDSIKRDWFERGKKEVLTVPELYGLEKQKEQKPSCWNSPIMTNEMIMEKQKERPKEELVYRLNGLMQDYIKEGKDDEEKEHRFKCYQLFWDALEDASYFEQKEQKHSNGCFTCDEYKKGYEEGRRNGFTAGYNKAMKEVEQKPVVTHGETYRVDTLGTQQVIAGKMPQKPAEWSEEDERNLYNIIEAIKYSYDVSEGSGGLRLITWLKYHLRYQSHWKPSENKDVYEIAYERYPINNRLVREVTKDINEDTRDGFVDGYNYCNSTHWKPSKKQMEALEDAFRKDGGNEYRKVINSLYCDLQKLL